jgi:hypothetical protein
VPALVLVGQIGARTGFSPRRASVFRPLRTGLPPTGASPISRARLRSRGVPNLIRGQRIGRVPCDPKR